MTPRRGHGRKLSKKPCPCGLMATASAAIAAFDDTRWRSISAIVGSGSLEPRHDAHARTPQTADAKREAVNLMDSKRGDDENADLCVPQALDLSDGLTNVSGG